MLILTTSLVSAALIIWALATPLVHRREADQLVTEARQTLTPPVKGLGDIDEVDCDRAAQLLERALDLVPSSGGARRELPLAQGCSALRRGDLILAEGSLRTAARQMPRDPRPRRWLGSLALAQGEPEQAIEHFRRGAQMAEGDPICQVGLSDALAETGRPEEALAALELLDGSATTLIQTRRGMLLEELGQLDAARAAYLRAIELSPNRAEPRNNLAALERDTGDLDAAWRLQRQALERAPDDPVILLNTGLLAIARGHDDEAHRLLSRAAELDRSSADPARALADHLLVRGRADEAFEVLGEALSRFPRDGALHNSLGNALSAAGRIDEARAAYRRAIEAEPTLAEPHNGLAALALAEGDLEAVEDHLVRALRLDPENRQARRNLAELDRRRAARTQSAPRLAQVTASPRIP